MKEPPLLETRIRRAGTLLVTALLVLSVFGPIGTTAAAGETAVAVLPANDSVAVGEETTIDIVVESDGGVSAAELGIELDNPGVASITAVSIAGNPSSKQVDIAENGESATMAYFGVSTAESGDVSIVTVTIEGEAVGETGVSVVPRGDNEGVLLFDQQGAPYTVTSVGSATQTITAADDGDDANSPPTADAGADRTVDAGDSVTLDATDSSDSDGSIVDYLWTQSGDSSVSLSDASAAQPTFTAPDVDSAQTLSFTVEVTDDDGASDTDTVSVTVVPTDDEPDDGDGPTTDLTLSPGEQTITSGEETTVDVVVENVDGGVGAGELTVSVDDPSVTTLTAIEVAGGTQNGFVESVVAEDGASATIEYATADTADSGSAPIVTVTLHGADVGSTALSIDDAVLYDESGDPYTVSETSSASITVEDSPFTVSEVDSPPTLVVGDTGTVTAEITNEGAASTTKAVTFTVDGQTVATEEVTLDAGESTTVEFSLSAGATVGMQSFAISTADDSQSGQVEITPPVVGNSQGPPTDPDGDGLYEDVNGDGDVDVGDVQTLFAHRGDSEIQEHVIAFDYNQDGIVDVGDVQTLFTEQPSVEVQ